MLKFALKENINAVGTIKVYNLKINGIDQIDAFEDQLEDKYLSQFRSISSTIYQISDNKKPPPRGKRRKIGGLKGAVELRSKNLRLYYLVIEKHDLIICIGGLKTTQNKDIRRLKTLKEQIENQINQNGQLKIEAN